LKAAAVAQKIYEVDDPTPECEGNARAALHEIRSKLREYYGRPQIDPAKNPVIIEMMKGHVRATYRLREAADQRVVAPAIRKTTSARHEALIGSWHGQGGDTWVENNAPLFSFEVTAEFRVDGSDVFGDFTIRVLESTHDEPVQLDLRGKFYDDSIIQTSYEATALGRKQAGVALLKLSGDTKKIYVRYSAFSPIRDCLIMGGILLEKNAPISAEAAVRRGA
jgi:hypothetical protein